MKASEFVAQQLGQSEAYGSQYLDQPRASCTFRLPCELIAWLDALKAKGLGDSRNDVMIVMLDVAIEQISSLGVCGDESDLYDMVQAMKEQLELRLVEGAE